MSELSLPFKHSVKDRMEVIGPLVTGSKTLDLGVVDSRTQKDATAARLTVKGATSLHAAIREFNDDVLGVDIDSESIDILSGLDYKVKVADVITMQLGEKFETIIAGDIIEHLDNAGQFLCNLAEYLTDEGVLVITTPNPFYIKQTWKIWRYNRPQVHEAHTCWFCPGTLTNLCSRCGLKVTAIHWIRRPGQWIRTWPKHLRDYFSNSFMLLAEKR